VIVNMKHVKNNRKTKRDESNNPEFGKP
jgi:hypothetical protein